MQVQPPYWAQLQEDLQDACHLPDADAFEQALHEAAPEVDQVEGQSPMHPHGMGRTGAEASASPAHSASRVEAAGKEADEAGGWDEAGGGEEAAEAEAWDGAEAGEGMLQGQDAQEGSEGVGDHDEEPEALPPMLFYGVCGQQASLSRCHIWVCSDVCACVLVLVHLLVFSPSLPPRGPISACLPAVLCAAAACAREL